jgi:hypothetical protein
MMAKQIGSWNLPNGITRVQDISPDELDEWKTSWHPKSKRLQNRIGKTTAGDAQKIH